MQFRERDFHIRTFKNVFDAFGCGEYFVAVENGEREMPHRFQGRRLPSIKNVYSKL